MNRVSMVLGLILAGPASALSPIDDFERGEFTASSATNYREAFVWIPAYMGHAVAPDRIVVLSPDGGPVSAVGAADQTFDDFVEIEVQGSGWCALDYRWGLPMDLTDEGALDRIRLDMQAGSIGCEITIVIANDLVNEGVTRMAAGGSELMTWDLADWTGVDVTQATALSIRFGPAIEPYKLWDARFLRRESQDVDFEGSFVATQLPPVPSPPLRFQIWEAVAQPIYEVDVVVQDADAGFTPDMHVEWSEIQVERGAFAAMDFYWDDGALFLPTTFELRLDFRAANDWVAVAYPPDPVAPPEGIFLSFPVRLEEEGAVVGISETRLLIDPLPGQELSFENVVVTENPVARNWGPSFTVSFDVTPGGVDDALPVFQATWISDWQETPLVSVPGSTAVSGGGATTLRATPSVTRGTTVLRSSAPLEAGTLLSVHDVAGRLVRTLAASDGARAVQWDGRDGFGRWTPEGVYFIRLDGADATPARVVRVR